MLPNIIKRQDVEAFSKYAVHLRYKLCEEDAQHFAKGCVLFNQRQFYQLAKDNLGPYLLNSYTSLFLLLALNARFNKLNSDAELKACNFWFKKVSSDKQAKLANLVGLDCIWRNRFDEARAWLEKSRNLDKNCLDPLINQNILYEKTDDYLPLLANLEALLTQKPIDFNINMSLLRTLIKLGKSTAALSAANSFRKKQLKLNAAELKTLRKYELNALIELRHSSTLTDLREMREYFSDYNDWNLAIWDHALDLIKVGKIERGYKLYSRFRGKGQPNPVKLINPVNHLLRYCWTKNASIVLLEEQGIGDIIQFLMMLPTFVRKFIPRKVELLVEPRLARALEVHLNPEFRQATGIRIISDKTLVTADNFLFVGDLPRYCIGEFINNSGADIPLLQKKSPKYPLGIVWRGGAKKVDQLKRSLRIDEFAKALPRSANVLALQYNINEAEMEIINENKILRPNYDCMNDLVRWFSDILSCEIVVGIDNSAMHVAGSAFIPTKILSRIPFEFRWGVGKQLFYQGQELHFVGDENKRHLQMKTVCKMN